MSDRDVSPGDDYERRRKRDRSYDDDDKEDRRSGKHRSRSRSSRRHRSRSKSGSRSGKDKRYSRSYRSRSRSANSSRKRHAYGDTPDPSRCLGVFGMSLYTTDHELHHVLSKYGPLEKVNVVKDAKTGRSRGFAFAYFESLEDAKMAKEACNGIELDGRRIRCDFSITQRAHTPTPGIYMGRPSYSDRDRRVSGSGSSRRSPRRRTPSRDRDYSRRRDYKSRSRSYSPRRY